MGDAMLKVSQANLDSSVVARVALESELRSCRMNLQQAEADLDEATARQVSGGATATRPLLRLPTHHSMLKQQAACMFI